MLHTCRLFSNLLASNCVALTMHLVGMFTIHAGKHWDSYAA